MSGQQPNREGVGPEWVRESNREEQIAAYYDKHGHVPARMFAPTSDPKANLAALQEKPMISFCKSPITEICYDLSWNHYRNREGISQSWLKLFDRDCGGAPAKAKFYTEHPELKPPPSEAMEEGSCYHAFVLQPDCFEQFYSVCTPSLEAELYAEAVADKSKAKGFSRSLGTYKAWKDSQEEMGRKVISQERENQLRTMRYALLSNKEIAEYFDGAKLEVSAFAPHDTAHGSQLQLKGRFDLLSGDKTAILDLKSCRTK